MSLQFSVSFMENSDIFEDNLKEQRLNSYLVMNISDFVHNLLCSEDDIRYNKNIIGTYDNVLKTIEENWVNLSKYKTPTREMCLIAIKQNPFAIQYIDVNSDIYQELCDIAIDIDFRVIKVIENPTFLQCVNAIDKNICAIKYINNPSQEVRNYAIMKDPSVIRYFGDLTLKECELAVHLDGLVLKYIKNQYNYRVDNFIDKYGFVTTKPKLVLASLCYIAVNQNPEALQFVIKQNDDICEKAVAIDGMCLRFVKNKTEKICNIAVKQNPKAQLYIY